MTFRARVALVATVAVAAAVIVSAVAMYLIVQRQIQAQADQTLLDTAEAVLRLPRRIAPGGGAALLSARPDVFAQVVTADGEVTVSNVPGSAIGGIITREVQDVAARRRDSWLGDLYVKGVNDDRTYHVRVYAVPIGQSQALELASMRTEVDNALAEAGRTLVFVAAGGVLLAALLGAAVAGAALVPVRRLTRAIEDVTRTRDLRRRVGARGSDELARLGRSFDEMLVALDLSLRQQRQLVADASHELRTPLTSLRTNLELLERNAIADPAERTQLLHDVVAQIERLSELVADLIDLARDEEVPLPVEDVRLDEVATTAIDEVHMRYPQIRFISELDRSSVRGVRSRIARAITNLLDNAAKWSPPGGVVEVRIDGSEVVVRDHGPGISAEDSPHVFDRFWRAASARHLPGSGLGLSIVKQVAEAHGGSVTLEHPTDGGARFRLRFGLAPST